MTEDLNRKLRTAFGREHVPDIPPIEDVFETFNCFKCVKGANRRADTLEIKNTQGDSVSVDWAYMPEVLFKGGTHIKLFFASRGFTINVRGRNLLHLKERLNLRDVTCMFPGVKDTGDGDFIESIDMVAHGDETQEMSKIIGWLK